MLHSKGKPPKGFGPGLLKRCGDRVLAICRGTGRPVEFFGIPGQSARSPQSFEETRRILPQLPSELARKIGRDNAARVYGLD